MSITESLKPYVQEIIGSAKRGNKDAQQIIKMHQMHCACPSDPGAPTLCQAYFDAWLKARQAKP